MPEWIDYEDGEKEHGTFSMSGRTWPNPCSLGQDTTTPGVCQWCGWATSQHKEEYEARSRE